MVLTRGLSSSGSLFRDRRGGGPGLLCRGDPMSAVRFDGMARRGGSCRRTELSGRSGRRLPRFCRDSHGIGGESGILPRIRPEILVEYVFFRAAARQGFLWMFRDRLLRGNSFSKPCTMFFVKIQCGPCLRQVLMEPTIGHNIWIKSKYRLGGVLLGGD